MIIKSWSIKHGQNKNSINNVLYYIDRNAESESAILWNMMTNEINVDKIISEFKKNSDFINTRKDGNLLYHETISFNGMDQINNEILEDITREYLELRAKNALAY